MRNNFVRSLQAAFLLALAAPFTNTSLSAEEKAAPAGRVMIVLDASGSMLGQIDGKRKIDIARDALRNIMNDWDSALQVGLMAYGHREKGNCDDIEVLVPVGPPNKESILAAADKLTPLGKTPLSEATLQAAEALKYSEEAASVILISDGEETCDKDPCAIGTELEGKGVNFTAHVIGFDIDKAEHIAQLKCLAENTGGKYVSAKDSGELQSALKTVVQEVKTETKEPKKEDTADKYRFTAYLSEDKKEEPAELRWELYKGRDEDGKPKDVAAVGYHNKWAPNPDDVPPGKYVMVAEYGTAKVVRDWDTETSPRVTVNLNAGTIELSAVFDGGTEPIEGAWTYGLFDGKPEVAEVNYSASPTVKVAAGKYLIQHSIGEAKTTETVEIKPGEHLKKQFKVKAGIIKPTVLYSAEGEEVTDGIKWRVISTKTDSMEKEIELSSSYAAKAEFTVPVGDVIVEAKVGASTIKSEPLKVENGKILKPVLNLNSGLLVVTRSSDEGSFEVLDTKKNIKGERKQVSFSYAKNYTETLKEGKYILVYKAGDKSEEKEIEIKAGERAEVEFK